MYLIHFFDQSNYEFVMSLHSTREAAEASITPPAARTAAARSSRSSLCHLRRGGTNCSTTAARAFTFTWSSATAGPPSKLASTAEKTSPLRER